MKVSSFHSFVKPTIHPVLTEFCKKLTGISQDVINKAETFDLVYARFLNWINTTPAKDSFVVLTDGWCDMSRFLYLQCLMSHLEFPLWAESFIDIKCTFRSAKDIVDKTRLMTMLRAYGLAFEGRLHSGKDDAFNIARLAIAMLDSGCSLEINASVFPDRKKILEKSLSTYMKRNKRHKKIQGNNRQKFSKKKGGKKADDDCSAGQMDIDPDLVGCENVLLRHKSK